MSYLDSLFSLEGKTALITGGTRGIGQAITLALANAGADIVLVQRSKENLVTYTQVLRIGRSCQVVVADLASGEDVRGLASMVVGKKEDGGLEAEIDILVNCAGIIRRGSAETCSEEDFDDVIQVNLRAVFVLSRDIGKHMLASRGDASAPNSRGRAKIINVASMVSFQGGVTVSAYTASKHGVLGVTRALSNEWSSKGINVNAFAPGYVVTDMNEALLNNPARSKQIIERLPAERWGETSDFEGVIVFLASSASDYVCGQCIAIDGGWLVR